MLHYIIQVLCFQILFLMVYDLFLKKETFFQWNRFYLMITSVVAYVIPLIKVKGIANYIQKEFRFKPILLDEIKLTSNNVGAFLTIKNLYYLGIIVMALLFIIKVTRIVTKIHLNKIINKSGYKLVILKTKNSAFSFFNYIFLGELIYKNDYQHILEHELIHVKQKHSIDLLFFELQKIVFWFNPLSYIYQRYISTLHEYIADSKTIKEKNKSTFFENLLFQTFNIEKIAFVNNYYKQSLLKKRIIMATKNKSKQILKMKYLLVLPILAVMFIYTSCTSEKKNDFDKNSSVKAPNLPAPPAPVGDKTNIETVPFSQIDQVPIYPGCENMNNEDAKTCMQQKITKHIGKNFNVAMAQNLDLPIGKQRISVQFKIDKQGNIIEVKSHAPHPKLKEEAIRIIKLLPKMKPGEENGNPVDVMYNLPIVFKVEGEVKK